MLAQIGVTLPSNTYYIYELNETDQKVYEHAYALFVNTYDNVKITFLKQPSEALETVRWLTTEFGIENAIRRAKDRPANAN